MSSRCSDRYHIYAFALAGTVLLTSCGYVPAVQRLDLGQGFESSATRGTAMLRVRVPNAGEYYGVLAVGNYTRSNINHLIIKVFQLNGSSETPVLDGANRPIMVDLLNSELDYSVTFGNLYFDTTYRIRCYAYKNAGTAEADLISTTDSNSYADVTLTQSNQANVTTLKVRLIDVSNTGDAVATGVDITDGGYQSSGPAGAQKHGYQVSTIAGSGDYGQVNGLAAMASFANPLGLKLAAGGQLYVVDKDNHVVRLIASNGQVSTFAGAGIAGNADGQSGAAKFSAPADVSLDANGNVLVADTGNHSIRRIDSDGTVTTVAGTGMAGSSNGSAGVASFNTPKGIAVDASGNLYVADTLNHRIRKVTPDRIVSTLSGSTAGFQDGTIDVARFNSPQGLVVEANGNVYVADTGSHRIRKISSTGQVSTIAGIGTPGYADGSGSSAAFNGPTRLAIDASGNLYVSDTGNNRIRKISPSGYVSTVAGNGNISFLDGDAASASFDSPCGIAVNSLGDLFIADTNNERVRMISRP